MLRGLSILEEVFTALHIAAWLDHPFITIAEELPGLVDVRITNPAVTEREVRIRLTAFDLVVSVMDWEEAYEWSEESYDALHTHIVNTLIAVLSDKLEILRYGRSLVVLRFKRNDEVTYRLKILSGVLVSPFSTRSENVGPFRSPYGLDTRRH